MTELFAFISVPANATKLATLVVLTLFLPLNALTYQLFRSHRKKAKIERILALLKVREQDQKRYHDLRTGRYLMIAVTYATIVSVLGLTILLFGEQMQLDRVAMGARGPGAGQAAATSTAAKSPADTPPAAKSPADTSPAAAAPAAASPATDSFPARRSWLMFGMGFLGGYLWGIQYVFRRYADDDLAPGVYHALAIRMMLAGTLAVLLYNAYDALATNPVAGGGKVWPALAFVLGMFPQRGLSWLRERVPFFSKDDDASVRKAPLEMIEGLTYEDRVRLEEESIDNCYDLATADFVPLVIHTPYSARELTDWILQAKLCVYAPEAMLNLRQQGIRTIMDLEDLDGQQVQELAQATQVTKPALERAVKSLKTDDEIQRLRYVGKRLSKFTGLEDALASAGGKGADGSAKAEAA
jgi:hypothetical protein